MPPIVTNARGEVRVVKTVYIPVDLYEELAAIANTSNRKMTGVITDTLRVGLTAAGAEFGPIGYELNLLYLAGILTLVANIAFYRWGKKRFFVRQPAAPEKPRPAS